MEGGLQKVKHRNQEGNLYHDGDATHKGIDLLLPVEIHDLDLALFGLFLILFLDRLNLGRDQLHPSHRFDRPCIERVEKDPQKDGEQDDRYAPGVGQGVEEGHHHKEDLCEGLGDKGKPPKKGAASKVVGVVSCCWVREGFVDSF